MAGVWVLALHSKLVLFHDETRGKALQMSATFSINTTWIICNAQLYTPSLTIHLGCALPTVTSSILLSGDAQKHGLPAKASQQSIMPQKAPVLI